MQPEQCHCQHDSHSIPSVSLMPTLLHHLNHADNKYLMNNKYTFIFKYNSSLFFLSLRKREGCKYRSPPLLVGEERISLDSQSL